MKRRYNTFHLADLHEELLHEPDAADERHERRRKRLATSVIVTSVAGLAIGAVWFDQTELDGMMTGNLGHEAGVAVHEGAIALQGAVDGAMRWVEDHTPER